MKTRGLVIAILLLGAAGVAAADQQDKDHDKDSHDRSRDHSVPTLAAPEIDSAGIFAALTLLGGAFAVLRGPRGMQAR